MGSSAEPTGAAHAKAGGCSTATIASISFCSNSSRAAATGGVGLELLVSARSGHSNPRFSRTADRSAVISGSLQKKRSFSSATVFFPGSPPNTKTAKVSAISSWK